MDTVERGAVCVTATYGLNSNGTVSVHNYAREKDPVNGKVYTINGFAVQSDPKTYPGRLTVCGL